MSHGMIIVRYKTVVVKVSGKFITPDKPDMIKSYVEVFKQIHESNVRLAIVIGGGRIAREYISAAGRLGVNRGLLDLLGIEASRLNARLLAYALQPYAYPEPPRSLWEVLEAMATGRIVVVGGFQPGQSTAGVAALVAEALTADLLVVATTVDGVYTSDPRRDPNARLVKKLDYKLLRQILSQSVEPGRYELLDPLAIFVLERSGIPTRIVNGSDPLNVARAISGEEVGSLIS